MANHMKEILILAFVAILVSIASGCSTMMSGKKVAWIPSDTDSIEGVPYHLTRPEFIITETPIDGKKANYEVAIRWVSDPKQRFTLNIDPALLTEIDFGMTFGVHGNIVGTSSKSREKVGPTIESLGSFVASAIGTATTVAGFDVAEKTERKSAWKLLKIRLDDLEKKKILWDTGKFPSITKTLDSYFNCGAPEDISENFWRDADQVEIKNLNRWKKKIDKGDGSMQDILPLSMQDILPLSMQDILPLSMPDNLDRLWLVTAQRAVKCEKKKTQADELYCSDKVNKDRQKLKDKIKQIHDNHHDLSKEQLLALTALENAANEGDLEKTKSAMEETIKKIPNLKPDDRNSIELAPMDLASLITKWSQEKQKLAELERETSLVDYILEKDDQYKLHVARLFEKKIENIERNITSELSKGNPLPVNLKNQIESVKRGWLEVVGASEEGERERSLMVFLKTEIKPYLLTAENPADVVQNFILARQELTEVRKVIQQKRNSLNPSPVAVAPSRKASAVMFLSENHESSDAKWVKTQLEQSLQNQPGMKAPEFIIVLERGYHK